MRAAKSLPDNWAEGDTYVVAGTTDEAFAAKMTLKTPAADVPEIGKLVGIENGACSKTCHGGVKGDGRLLGRLVERGRQEPRATRVMPISDSTRQARRPRLLGPGHLGAGGLRPRARSPAR